MRGTASAGVEWTLGLGVSLAWNVLGAAISVLGAATLLELYKATHPVVLEDTLYPDSLPGALVGIGLPFLAIVLGHELVHGFVMRLFGARPRYGVGMAARILPYLYCTTAGQHRFTRPQFTVIALAPAVLITAVGSLLVVGAPHGGWLVAPLGIHLGGCIGDVWVCSVALRQPRGTLIEDFKSGVRFHRHDSGS